MTTPADDEIRRIYQATLDDLYGFVSHRCGGDRDLAEDVTQEIWLRAVRAWADDGIPKRPLAWLTARDGRGMRRDPERAATFRPRACEYGHKAGCAKPPQA